MNFLLRFKPPRIALVFIVVGLVVHLAFFRQFNFFVEYLALGGLVIAGGFLMMIMAWQLFKKQRVGICPTAPSSLLITSGVFKISRNPMYLGILLMIGGMAIGLRSIPLVCSGILFFVVINYVFIPYEEKKLERDLGKAFLYYRTGVGRWL